MTDDLVAFLKACVAAEEAAACEGYRSEWAPTGERPLGVDEDEIERRMRLYEEGQRKYQAWRKSQRPGEEDSRDR